jgi:hypothetical protein
MAFLEVVRWMILWFFLIFGLVASLQAIFDKPEKAFILSPSKMPYVLVFAVCMFILSWIVIL